MTPHQSSYNIKIPFGKYKGLSLGFIWDANKGYLEWLSSTESMPILWREAAAMTLLGEDLSKKFPTAESLKSTSHAQVKFIDNKTLQVNFDYDEDLLARFKHEIDGRKWNMEEKFWEIPAVQIIKFVDLMGGTKNVTADEKTKEIYKEEIKRRQDLEAIRNKQDTDLDGAPTVVGKIKNWNEIATFF